CKIRRHIWAIGPVKETRWHSMMLSHREHARIVDFISPIGKTRAFLIKFLDQFCRYCVFLGRSLVQIGSVQGRRELPPCIGLTPENESLVDIEVMPTGQFLPKLSLKLIPFLEFMCVECRHFVVPSESHFLAAV